MQFTPRFDDFSTSTMMFTFNDSERPTKCPPIKKKKKKKAHKLASAGLFLAEAWQKKRGPLSPLLHLSFHLLSVASPPSIHFLHQAAISHSVHLTLGPIRSALRPLSLLLSSFSLCRSGERWQLWQRQSADAGLKSDRPCPAATQLGSRRSITPWHTQSSTERRERAGRMERGGGVRAGGQVEGE